ncbi:MAG TPA: DUF1707 domain-containing protein [Trebonia sp.]|jgi:hypothetical protein|nr:DUF1707 domain-containing protein [Trebonia sp.]
MPPRPAPRDLRASDADRERVTAVLNAALSDGRLTSQEHDERVHAALTARTLGELAGLTTDLVTPDGQPIRLHDEQAVTVLFRKESRGGRWVVPAALTVNVVGGELTLDFREAILTDRHTVLYAHVGAGTLRLFVPDGVTVTVEGTLVLARHKGTASRDVPPPLDAPLIEVRALAVVGEILVKAPPKQRRWLPGGRRQVRG